MLNLDFYKVIDSDLCEVETTFLDFNPHEYKHSTAHRLFAASRKMAFGEQSLLAMEAQFKRGMCEALHKLQDPRTTSEIYQPNYHKCGLTFLEHRKELYLVIKVLRDTNAAELQEHLQPIKHRAVIDGFVGIRINENGFTVESPT